MSGLRYVILHHEGVERPHYDLMFETAEGSDLTTFRCDTWPIDKATMIEKLPDHRRAYLTYEGPVSGNRGSVRRVAGGECAILLHDADHCEIQLNGGSRLLMQREAAGWSIRFKRA